MFKLPPAEKAAVLRSSQQNDPRSRQGHRSSLPAQHLAHDAAGILSTEFAPFIICVLHSTSDKQNVCIQQCHLLICILFGSRKPDTVLMDVALLRVDLGEWNHILPSVNAAKW
jgi:hypothetical protein